MIKSRPLYAPLKLDPAGRTHLIMCDQPVIPEAVIEVDLSLSNIEILTLQNTVTDLLNLLQEKLQNAAIGLRLYAIGTEAFLWDVNNTALAAGLGKGEVFLTQAGSLRRRVYCTHCKTMNQDVVASIISCIGCGANLFVRDHFSRRLAAFMGICIDAEIPGVVPAAEILYP